MTKVIIAAIIFAVGYSYGQGNQEPTYGDSGLPKNCRAIIASNVDGVISKQFTPMDALHSINRNCGRNGYSWDNR